MKKIEKAEKIEIYLIQYNIKYITLYKIYHEC
jgi:hypothetical protein